MRLSTLLFVIVLFAGFAGILSGNIALAVTPTISINNVSVSEGDSGTASAIFTVTLSPASTDVVTVNYATSDGSANAGSDYTFSSGMLSFAPGETSKVISVQVFGDTIPEGNETINVNLSNPINATIGDSRGVATILDDDTTVGISINNVDVKEGDSGTRNAVFTVSLSATSSQIVTVYYATSDGTATAGSDYSPATGMLSFAPGEANKNIPVQVLGDATDEGNETFFVSLSSPTNATISDNKGTATILDDDPIPGITIGDTSIIEGNSGMVAAAFTVSLSIAGKQTVMVNYSTSDGTAIAGSDYVAAIGTLSFAPGEVTKTVYVQVFGDNIGESSETFFLNLSNPVNASLTVRKGTGTILNDDPTVGISINDISVIEGNSGTVAAAFTVSLSSTSSQTVMVNYGTTNGTAISGGDYTATSGTISFAPGDVTKTITVMVFGDTFDESNETFSVNLSNPINAVIDDNKGVCTILDDDPTPPSVTPGISINNVSVTEGDSGSRSAIFTVSLSSTSSQTVTVNYATADGTATAGSDYSPAAGTLSFAPGETARIVSVQVLGETAGEVDETFFVNLSNPVNATIKDRQGKGTILNDDPVVSISINSIDVAEGDSGTRYAIFTVNLSIAGKQTVTVNYATSNGSATAGSDYSPATGMLSFAPGDIAKTIPVQIIGDTADEGNETFYVNLSNPTNATISDNKGTATILDDDPTVGISINNVDIVEGDSGVRNAAFTVSLSTTGSQTVMVSYATSDGTAIAGSDYAAAIGTISFAPGEVTKTVSIQVFGDIDLEGDETFFLNLSNPVNASLTDRRGTGTILNDDPTVGISINDISVIEGNTGMVAAVFTVSLSSTSSQTVMVNYGTTNGTAISGSDYVAMSGTISFGPGEVTKTITVMVFGDTFDENNETFSVNLSNPINAVIIDGKGVGTILDDDPTP